MGTQAVMMPTVASRLWETNVRRRLQVLLKMRAWGQIEALGDGR